MGALGWLINLDFAASGVTDPAGRPVSASLSTSLSFAGSTSTSVSVTPGMQANVSTSSAMTEGS